MTIPSVGMYKDIAIYPDDENVNLYYCIRTNPNIRKEDGIPVFVGTFWTDKDAKDAVGASKLAGGMVNFDVCLGLTEAEEEAVKDHIEKNGIRDNRIAALKATKNEVKLHAGDEMQHFQYNFVLDKGTVEIRPVDYVESKLYIIDQEKGNLVDWMSNGQNSSKFGDNNASFALTLNALGADVWYRTLMEGEKALGVRYDLKYRVRLPSLSIRIHAATWKDAEIEGQAAVKKATYGLEKNCSAIKEDSVDPGDLTRRLVDNGLISIDIKRGTTSIPQDTVTEIWNSMFDIVKDKVKAIIDDKYVGMTSKERSESLLDYVMEDLDSFMDLYYNQQDVVEISVSPSCTMVDFLKGLSKENMARAVHLVDLRDPVLKPRRTANIMVSAQWDEIDSVVVKAKCGKEEKSFQFLKDTQPVTWEMKDLDADSLKEIEYSAEVWFPGVGVPCELPKKKTMSDIYVNVGHIGIIDVVFKPNPKQGTLKGLNSVSVDITYPQRDGTIGHRSLPDLLSHTEGVPFRKTVGAEIKEPLRYTTSYEFDDRKPVTVPEKAFYLSADERDIPIYLPYPYQDSLNINVIVPPFDKGSSFRYIQVEFKYEDKENDFTVNDSVYYHKEDDDDMKLTARLPVINRTCTAFKYRFIVYGDQFYQSPWLDGKGDDESLIVPVQSVLIDYSLLGMGEKYQWLDLEVFDKETGERLAGFTRKGKKAEEEETLEFFTVEKRDREFKYKLNLIETATGTPHDFEGSWKGRIFMFPAL